MQFSLLGLLAAVSASAVLFAIAARFPEPTAIALLMTGLALSPLIVTRAILVVAALVVGNTVKAPALCHVAGPRSFTRYLLLPFEMLGLVQPSQSPTFVAALATAVVATITIAGLWPLLREVGLTISLISVYAPARLWQYIERGWPTTFSSTEYWQRLCLWELWSVSRWWLLFGLLANLWWALSWPHERWRQLLSRLLYFGPWLIVLEMAFLIGVWIETPNVVPEPSTGFVVGIFSWDLWHWDCWLDREWLIRGAVPTFVVGVVFFNRVLRWHWLAAVLGALGLVPPALMLSIASTVLYLDVRF